MKIVEGGFPEDKAWRSLVLLSIEEELRVTWQLGLDLALANEGEVVAAVIIPSTNGDSLTQARNTLAQARRACDPEDPLYTVIIQDKDYTKGVRRFVHEADIDLLLASADVPHWHNLNRMPCAVLAVRGEAYGPNEDEDHIDDTEENGIGFKQILVPTSGGPNSVHALNFLLPLADHDVQIVALYVAPAYLGDHEHALGRSRLRRTLNYIDAGDKIESRLIVADTVTGGIVEQATGEADLVIIGASRESSLDRTIFGNIPDAVVRQCKKPVAVVQEPANPVGNLFRQISWSMQRILPRLNLSDRTQAYVRIRRSARPNIDFYILLGLASAIAALGLLANSAAVVIGAMLVAPLMAPMSGTGLAMVLGDARFLRLSLGAVLRGSLIAILMGLIVGLIPIPEPMTGEVLSRTQPTLIDLAVAVLSGMAVAYALTRSTAAAALPGVAIAAALVPPLAAAGISLANLQLQEGGGALLLFLTNFVAISSASALVFLTLGFRPTRAQKERRAAQVRSAQVAVILLIIVTIVLAITTISLARESAIEAEIRDLAETGVREIMNAELAEIDTGNLNAEVLDLAIIVRSSRTIPHSAVVELQEFLATELQREVALVLTVIPTTELDPFVPPTLTPTKIPTNTPTAGPSLTFTPTRTPSPTATATSTPSPTATATASPTVTPSPTDEPSATPTPVPTSTPPLAVVDYTFGLNMRSEPAAGSTLVNFIEDGSTVVLLPGIQTNDEGTWQEIEVGGQRGWVLADFLGSAVN
jgi:uncharacterized hydrophobic protein (TIGR00271 family)